MSRTLAPFAAPFPFRAIGALDEAAAPLAGLPDRPGVYVLAARRTRFPYPRGRSSVFDIEPTRDVRKSLQLVRQFTLQARDERSQPVHGPLWEYGARFGVRAWFVPISSFTAGRDLADELIARFVLRYRAQPVGGFRRSLPVLDALDPTALAPQGAQTSPSS